MSTMLLIGFSPSAVSRHCSQAGEGFTVTFSKTSALYRGQRSKFSISTPMAGGASGSSSRFAGSLSPSPRIAATSRAMP
jgi:hypothetical protein